MEGYYTGLIVGLICLKVVLIIIWCLRLKARSDLANRLQQQPRIIVVEQPQGFTPNMPRQDIHDAQMAQPPPYEGRKMEGTDEAPPPYPAQWPGGAPPVDQQQSFRFPHPAVMGQYPGAAGRVDSRVEPDTNKLI